MKQRNIARIPFDLETAKKISNGEMDGRIVTRDGRAARIVRWDLDNESYPLIGVFKSDGDNEDYQTYSKDGYKYNPKHPDLDDLIIEMTSYTNLKDGDLMANSDGDFLFILKENGKYNTSFYAALTISGLDIPTQGQERAAAGDSIELYRFATATERNRFIGELKNSHNPIAKEYLKRFFGIEQKDEPKFNPYDRVLCRNSVGVWFADFFSHIGEDGRFCCIGGFYKHCIPYEGNEHLLGTTDDKEE